MMRDWKIEMKVGVFALVTLAIIAYSTLKIGEGNFFFGGGYDIVVTLDSATGVGVNTPVEIAGIKIGFVRTVGLAEDGRRARATIRVDRHGVKVPEHSEIVVRAKGFLGDTYLELIPGPIEGAAIPAGGTVAFGGAGGDVNALISRFTDIANDLKGVTSTLKDIMVRDDSPIRNTVTNLDKFAELVLALTEKNQHNLNTITANFAELSTTLRHLIAQGEMDIEDSMSRIASITRKVDQGEGTIGRLINDEETVNKVNDTIDTLNDTLGGLKKLQTEIGYHTEYLGGSKDLKHYVHLNLWPRPDEAFLFEFVEDRSPSAERSEKITDITAGGATTQVTTSTQTIDRNKMRVSAQLAKRFYDFTLRGGLIESRGGVGVDYRKGPIGLSASAFDFNTQAGSKPHLKFTGTVNVTPGIQLIGGADDPLNPNQSVDWFVGAGLTLVDDDIKSLMSGAGLSSVVGR